MKERNKSILAFLGLTNLGWATFKRSTLITALVCISLFFSPSLVSAQDGGDEEEIEFSVDWGDPTPGGLGHSKTPILMPTLWQNGYLLDFHGTHTDYVLRIVDAADNVVYMAVVPSFQTQGWLPTTLSGTYRIELISGDLLFYGFITL
jgi:hypothetical protein